MICLQIDMRIVYDNIIFSLQKAGGISVYWSELIRRLIKRKADVCFYGTANENLFGKTLPIKQRCEHGLPVHLLRYLPFTKKLPADAIFHSSYYRVSLQKNIYNIVTVHDFTYEQFGHGIAKYVHHFQKAFALKRADGVICVSKQTEKDLYTFFPRLNKPVRVIYLGANEMFRVLADEEKNGDTFHEITDKKFVLFVGGRKGYKNFLRAVETLAGMKEYYFVVVGGGKLSPQEQGLLTCLLPDRFIHYPSVSEMELNVLYNRAFCLLYPSLYEGFGIPVLEAMCAGCPVLAMKRSSIPEVVGDAALLCETDQASEFIQQIHLLEDESMRKKFIQKGLLRSEQFHWDKCFEETWAFYKRIAYTNKVSL